MDKKPNNGTDDYGNKNGTDEPFETKTTFPDGFVELHKEYWQQIRHLEWRRSSFAASYVFLLGAVIGILKFTDIELSLGAINYLLAFLFSVSFAGYLLILSWSAPIILFRHIIGMIVTKVWNIEDEFARFEGYKTVKVSDKSIFMTFYAIMTSGFAATIYYVNIFGAYTSFNNDFFSILLFCIISISMSIFYFMFIRHAQHQAKIKSKKILGIKNDDAEILNRHCIICKIKKWFGLE